MLPAKRPSQVVQKLTRSGPAEADGRRSGLPLPQLTGWPNYGVVPDDTDPSTSLKRIPFDRSAGLVALLSKSEAMMLTSAFRTDANHTQLPMT